MPALATVVSDYLTAVKDALTTGTATGSDMNAAAQNYLRAQDMATVLDLLQEALTQPLALTAVSGNTVSVTDGVATFVAGTQVGNTVTFAGNVTAAIAGESRVVISNTTTTLTFSSDDPLSGSVAIGDTYTIEGTMLAASVATLRDGKGVADATPGNPYGDQREVIQGIMLGVERLGSAIAERNIGIAGLTSVAGSTDTVVVLSNSGYRVDELKGMRVAVATAGDGIVLKNDDNVVTLRGPMAASAAPGDAVTITVPVNDFGGTSAPKIVTHSGAQPGENAFLANLIDQLETLVVAFTLPT